MEYLCNSRGLGSMELAWIGFWSKWAINFGILGAEKGPTPPQATTWVLQNSVANFEVENGWAQLPLLPVGWSMMRMMSGEWDLD